MDTRQSGHRNGMRSTADSMTNRVRVQDARAGMPVVWGGRIVRLTAVLRRSASQFVVRAEGGLEAEMAGTTVLKLAPDTKRA